MARHIDVPVSIDVLEYYAGWADGKITGKTVGPAANDRKHSRQSPQREHAHRVGSSRA